MAIKSHQLCANCWCTHAMHDRMLFENIADYTEPQRMNEVSAHASLVSCISNGGFVPGVQHIHPYDPD